MLFRILQERRDDHHDHNGDREGRDHGHSLEVIHRILRKDERDRKQDQQDRPEKLHDRARLRALFTERYRQ